MAWATSLHDTIASLCIQKGDVISVNNDCLALLEEVLENLSHESYNVRTFRKTTYFIQNIRKSIIPLLVHVKDDSKIPHATQILDTVIKILVNLTMPIEYLLPTQSKTMMDNEKQTILELNKHLTASKELFIDLRSTKAIVDHMKYVIEADSPMNLEQCNSINNSLLLLRNILHISETKTASTNGSSTCVQNQIIWNLFTQSIDKIIIYLISCHQKAFWSTTIVQVIALIYKDQHVGTLQKLLNMWLESSYSESSEDNESNTSPPPTGQQSDESSPLVTSDPTSDSSDNGGNDTKQHNCVTNSRVNNNSERSKNYNCNIIREVKNRSKNIIGMKRGKSTETESSSGISSMGPSLELTDDASIQSHATTSTGKQSALYSSTLSEVSASDCGYGTQVENHESISTSSNDDDRPHEKPIHQKPHTFQKTRYNGRATTILDKKELRRKKLVKRSKTNVINMKGLLHHLPTDEDISNLLKEFTVDFLLKGYGSLVQELHLQLLTNVHIPIDTSHFFWLVTYFLKFATQLEVDPEHINPVLSYEILSYLVFQGVWIHEELEISYSVPEIDLKPCLRRLHLVVTAIREFLQGLETYQKMIHLSDGDRNRLIKLQLQVSEMNDLKMLFILLLKQYNPNFQSRQYLQDLIVTNHNFLLFLDTTSRTYHQNFNMIEHLKHFASVDIMRQYGLLLENFKENGEFVNNCIFTMMHHIGGDLQNVSTLFQPGILKTFSQIWETDYQICDDWSDLIEYVIHKFVHNPNTHRAGTPVDNQREDFEDFDNISLSDTTPYSECSSLDEILILFRWTKEEKDDLLKYYNQSKECSNTIARISEKYEETGRRHKTPLSVIKELFEQDIITESEFDVLLKDNGVEVERRNSLKEKEVLQRNFKENNHDTCFDSDIKVLKEHLFKENKDYFLHWLQNLLMETCFVKSLVVNPEEFEDRQRVIEPTVYYFTLLNLPVPVIPWTVEQADVLKHQPFILLLHKLGFYLPSDTGKIFIRIPNFWTPDYIFRIALELGPIDAEKQKFDVNKFEGNQCDATARKSHNVLFCESENFYSVKEIPSAVRCTPLNSQLSISIPEAETISCNHPPPSLTIAKHIPTVEANLHSSMEYVAIEENDVLIDELERNSCCDTNSVASDLTRMCVSDEDDKIMTVCETHEPLPS